MNKKAVLAVVLLLSLLITGVAFSEEAKLKAGFIYVGPIGDLGWSHAHEQARQVLEEVYPWLDTIYVEAVPEGEVEGIIDRLINQEKVDIVVTTSFGFMDGTLNAAKRYPDKIFFHCSGFKRAPNLATYMADFHQVYYLNGIMAGALTKSGKIGYVGTFPTPELKRHINAFTLGVRRVNPQAEVNVRWLQSAWYDPQGAKEAAEALIAEGIDVLAFTEDSASVAQVAEEKGLPSFGHYSPMLSYAPNHLVSGQLVHWEAIYLDFFAKVYAGLYNNENLENVDYWWLLSNGAVELGADFGVPVNPAFEEALKSYMVNDPVYGEMSAYDLVFELEKAMADPEYAFSPFTGPIKDRKGNLLVPSSVRLALEDLITMEWAAEGVAGPWPGEPE
ncbi:MAG TPA: BMP family ABC transporter substrate-binding protein [Candidatus Atribacteria bacterium]|jgi:simple sugar transport system substrate-binding protein|uniref:BMP family ABC transporter substrate-binding protein n=1 Tax=Candidatus Sordicultor fermentans TaxID=1953203 RepID=UPI0016AA6EC4|nr:BMP family ABC transporter substrate-binding protein [Atribacterota bacterium]NLY05736.1 BMP family ABC transporter substrate-binding protein [Candidatus Atribacteria bacterium]MDI9607132.1 BMP family ABC transporter substrate-binding protein [Atribacterota bacterium]MDY0135237.1 BMP family ABC transporter substrate-binding protein [Atribacterota bacterium]HOA98778.1 BMP family ABC transporter substrate-binding protein [Candidatus Atribacteria bacterium]